MTIIEVLIGSRVNRDLPADFTTDYFDKHQIAEQL